MRHHSACCSVGGVVFEQGGNMGQACELGGGGAPMAGDQLITRRISVGGGHRFENDRLEDAGGFDGIGEFGQGYGVHGGTGLMGVGLDEGEIDQLERFAGDRSIGR